MAVRLEIRTQAALQVLLLLPHVLLLTFVLPPPARFCSVCARHLALQHTAAAAAAAPAPAAQQHTTAVSARPCC